MKQTYFYITLLFALLFMVSCEKDETKMIVLPASEVTPPEITLEGLSNYVTEEETIGLYPTVLSWTKTNLGNLEIPVTYTLEIDTAADFSSKTEISLGIGTYSYALSGKVLNNWGINYNVDSKNLERVDLFIRVGASVYVNNPTSIIVKPDTAFSEAVVVAVTPMLMETPVIYVPGNHQGWSPSNAPNLYSPERNNVYTGYVYLDGEFKFTSAPSWDGTNYGAGSAPKTLSTSNDAGNLTATVAGYYLVSADLTALTYNATLVEWYLIGEAIGGWGDNDQKLLKYDVSKGILTATVNMVPGEFKFRRDSNWDFALGGGTSEGILSSDGGNISFTGAAGTYTITLDLSKEPALYNYTISKAE